MKGSPCQLCPATAGDHTVGSPGCHPRKTILGEGCLGCWQNGKLEAALGLFSSVRLRELKASQWPATSSMLLSAPPPGTRDGVLPQFSGTGLSWRKGGTNKINREEAASPCQGAPAPCIHPPPFFRSWPIPLSWTPGLLGKRVPQGPLRLSAQQPRVSFSASLLFPF